MTVAMCIMLIVSSSVFGVVVKIPDASPAPNGKQGTTFLIVVNGRTLTGPNSSGRAISGRIMIPMASVARALGDFMNASPQNRSITVVRQTGMSARFDARLGQVVENGASVLAVSNSGEINFSLNADEILLPMEIAAALFDASFRVDPILNKVLVSRGQIAEGVATQGNKLAPVEIYQAEYEYSFSKYTGSLVQSLILEATGRIGDGRFRFNSNSSGTSIAHVTPGNFSFNLERPNGQRFTGGDFGAGGLLPLMSANVRGAFASIPAGRFTVAAFGGRANSGTVLPGTSDDEIQLVPFRSRPRFDTSVLGGYFSTANTRSTDPLIWSAGVMKFGGMRRNGILPSASISYAGSRLRIQGDLGIGSFEGFSAESKRVNGLGTALDLAATYLVNENLSIQGRYASIGRNFLSPQSGSREPMDLKAAGVSWSPSKRLSTSINASTMKRPGETGRADSYVTASFGVLPGGGKPRFYVSHTQSSSRLIKSGSFTIVNASKEFSRWRLFVNATRVKAIGPATVNAQFGASVNINDKNSLEGSLGVGSGGNLNGTIDWRSSGLFGDRLSFLAGGGYNYSQNGKISLFERVTATLKLPRWSSLQVNYINTDAGATMLVQLKGTLFRKRESAAYLNAPISEARNFGSVSGRVFQDLDGNGRYDAGSDKPQAGVKVRIDGSRYAVSDANGIYMFDAVTAGDHNIYLDLLSVRADLALSDGGRREITISGGQASSLDFRLLRTGRITGRVWLDTNGNGKFDEDESPLADVRVVTASLRDTLTDADGFFTITDLEPGEHIIFLDEKTLPEMTIPDSKPVTVSVRAGLETANLQLSVKRIPAEIKRFPSKIN